MPIICSPPFFDRPLSSTLRFSDVVNYDSSAMAERIAVDRFVSEFICWLHSLWRDEGDWREPAHLVATARAIADTPRLAWDAALGINSAIAPGSVDRLAAFLAASGSAGTALYAALSSQDALTHARRLCEAGERYWWGSLGAPIAQGREHDAAVEQVLACVTQWQDGKQIHRLDTSRAAPGWQIDGALSHGRVLRCFVQAPIGQIFCVSPETNDPATWVVLRLPRVGLDIRSCVVGWGLRNAPYQSAIQLREWLASGLVEESLRARGETGVAEFLKSATDAIRLASAPPRAQRVAPRRGSMRL